MPQTYTVPDNIALQAGPLLIGIVLNWFLFGILCVQYFLYVSKTTNDKKLTKATVHIIFILDTFQTFMMMDDVFHWYVYHFGNIAKLSEFHWSAINMALVDAIIAFIVQSFYIRRINQLGGWRVIPCILSLGALVAFGGGVFIAAADLKFPTAVGFRNDYRVGVVVWLLSSAITDIFIAMCTGYLLLRMAKESLNHNGISQRILRILTLTLETNAVTAAVALEIVIVSFIKSIASPRTKIFLPAGYVLGKLYSNCFMILLNQRHHYHENVQEFNSRGEMNSTLRFGVSSNSDNASAMSFAHPEAITLNGLGQVTVNKKVESETSVV